MATRMNKPNRRGLMLLLTAVGIAALWRVGDEVNSRVKLLAVQPAPALRSQPAISDSKSYYALWVRKAPAAAESGSNVDDAFRSPPPPKAPEPIFDAVAAVKARLPGMVTGMSDAGLFLGNSFVAVGQPLESLGIFDNAGRPVRPVLLASRVDGFDLQVGGKRISVQVGAGKGA